MTSATSQFIPIPILRASQLLYRLLLGKIFELNLFDSRSSSPVITHRERISTRVYLLLFSSSILILVSYASLSLRMRSETIHYPSYNTYRQLRERYSETLHCSCSRVSVAYGKFVRIDPVFHQVCSSDFISQRWIDYAFVANATVLWPMDIRTSLSAVWQMIASLCQSSKTMLVSALNEFASSQLVGSVLLSEQLLQAKAQAKLNAARQIASDNLMRLLITVHGITEVNGLMSDLMMALGIYAYTEIPTLLLKAQENKYIGTGSTTICRCDRFESCPLPGNIYSYTMWETNSTYDLNFIVANETLPGIVVDCSPLQITVASSLECFYNQTCFDILISAYAKAVNVSVLDKSYPSRFLPTTINKELIQELFLENILNQTVHNSYYDECLPTVCVFTYTRRFDWIFVLTTLIALVGGLNTTFRLLTPYLVQLAYFFKKILRRRLPPELRQNESKLANEIDSENRSVEQLSFTTSLGESNNTQRKSLLEKLKLAIIELNVFDKTSRNPLRIHRARVATRFYVGFLVIAVIILISYTSLTEETIRENSERPSLKEYERLEEKYVNTIECPCAKMSILHEEFIQHSPIYHQKCLSDFIQPSWFNSFLSPPFILTVQDTILHTASSYFRGLGVICTMANLMINTAMRRFYSTEFVNDKVLSRSSFQSQTDSLIDLFLKSTQTELLHAASLTNTMIYSNQYINGIMSNAQLQLYPFTERQQYGFEPMAVMAVSTFKLRDDGHACMCSHDPECYSSPYHDTSSVYISDSGLMTGCFLINTVLASSLRCWCSMKCFEEFRDGFTSMTSVNLPQINPLNATVSTRFSSNDSVQLIFKELMVEQWNLLADFG